MTTRLKGVTVTFTHDIREDDAEPILAALRMVKGVASVKRIEAEYEDHMARARVQSELGDALFAVAMDFMQGGKLVKELAKKKNERDST